MKSLFVLVLANIYGMASYAQLNNNRPGALPVFPQFNARMETFTEKSIDSLQNNLVTIVSIALKDTAQLKQVNIKFLNASNAVIQQSTININTNELWLKHNGDGTFEGYEVNYKTQGNQTLNRLMVELENRTGGKSNPVTIN